MSYDYESIREGDTITLLDPQTGSVLKNVKVGVTPIYGRLTALGVPGILVSYLDGYQKNGWIIIERRVKAPQNPGYYQSYTGRSVYLRTRYGRWFEMSRFGKVTEFSDADLEERPHLFPFKKIGDITSE